MNLKMFTNLTKKIMNSKIMFMNLKSLKSFTDFKSVCIFETKFRNFFKIMHLKNVQEIEKMLQILKKIMDLKFFMNLKKILKLKI